MADQDTGMEAVLSGSRALERWQVDAEGRKRREKRKKKEMPRGWGTTAERRTRQNAGE